jgi:hypothetical protein
MLHAPFAVALAVLMHRNLGVKRVADAGVREPLAPVHALSLGRVLGRGNFRKAVVEIFDTPITPSLAILLENVNAHSSSINDFGPIINPVADIRLPPTR